MHRSVLATLLVTLLLAGGCGAGGGFADDQPAAEGPRLEAGELEGVPTPGGTQPFGAPTQEDAAVTESFKVTGSSPEAVLRFYADALPALGWAVSTPPAESGEGRWREEWVRDDRLLQVTAEPDVDDGTGDIYGAPVSQLDLVLRAGPTG